MFQGCLCTSFKYGTFLSLSSSFYFFGGGGGEGGGSLVLSQSCLRYSFVLSSSLLFVLQSRLCVFQLYSVSHNHAGNDFALGRIKALSVIILSWVFALHSVMTLFHLSFIFSYSFSLEVFPNGFLELYLLSGIGRISLMFV